MMMDSFFSFFSVENVLIQFDGKEVSYLEALSMIAGLSCVFLAVRAKVFNFYIGYIYSMLLFTFFFQKNLYSSMMLQPISLVINAIGHYRWTHPRKSEENKKRELKITLLTNQQRIVILATLAGLTLGWGFAMANVNCWMPWPVVPSSLPYLDAFVVMTVLTAQWLSAQKKLDCWAAWMTVNLTNVTLYTLRGLVFMPFLSATYIVMAFFGARIWYRKYKCDNVIMS
ncbi:MAG: nicotinamide riboside transporter PnuC [Bacteroidales bacterium]|nr:nicotinamide riboside transporter PnuC [Bacteroidales bacterium]MCL2133291.1 nicotinamide riboside transporter PnuC [Bacteroidales bacterium]